MATAARLSQPHIVKEPGYCGGRATIDDTRIRVYSVVFVYKMGKTPEQILVEYPDLSLGQVYAALTYYYDNQEEIEAELAEDESWEVEHERRKTEYLVRQAPK